MAQLPVQQHWLTQRGTALLASPPPHTGGRVVLQVVEVLRYALDVDWFAASGETVRPECGDAFDVVFSDGVHKRKVTLSTTLNFRVYTGWLCARSVVCIEGWRIQHDELHLAEDMMPPLVIITKLATVPKFGEALPATPHIFRGLITSHENILRPKYTDQLEALVHAHGGVYEFVRHMEELPLFGARRHYLHLDSDNVHLPAKTE